MAKKKLTPQEMIEQLENKISELEILYSDTKSLDVRDELIIAKRAYFKYKGDPLVGCLYTDVHNEFNSNFVENKPLRGISL